MRKILFVCMGNICRSPTAHGVFLAHLNARGVADLFEVDSAGTHGYHIGAAPDTRTTNAARRRGYDLSSLRARRVSDNDFAHYDLIAAMDRNNLTSLMARCPPDHQHKLVLFMQFAPEMGADEVPDPYALTMGARVNGEEWSRGSSGEMHHKFEDILTHVSRDETVYPGEFFGSGTVGGGCGLEQGRFLKIGDVVELEVNGLGLLRNRVVASTVA
jgi:protein-tyrosine phosphatase